MPLLIILLILIGIAFGIFGLVGFWEELEKNDRNQNK